MNKKLELRVLSVLFLAVILLILTAVQASGFSYNVETVINRITKEETAEFNLTITNTADYEDFFTISTRDVNWVLSVSPNPDKVPAGETISVGVRLKPKAGIKVGITYFIPVSITSAKTGFFFEDKTAFIIHVINQSLPPGIYEPTVKPTITIDKRIDPREKVAVTLNLKNLNLRDLVNLKVAMNGEIFFKEYTAHLLPLEDKTNEILFEVDPFVTAGTRTLTLTLLFEDKKIAESTSDYEIIGYIDMQGIDTPVKKSFLFRTEETYTINNYGNQGGVAEKKFRINFFKRLFTRITPEPVKEEGLDGKTYYVIRQNLAPKQGLEIFVVSNYRLPVLIILVILLIIILYYALRTPIIIIKSAEPLGKTKDGVSEVKVRLYLKNRGRRPINNLRVVDSVPSIAEIEKKARLGSIEPVNIGKSKKGSVARWELDLLEPYEERIITYKIKSKLKLIGGIRLPSAKAKFDTKSGKERVTHSNNINLIHKQ